MVRKIDIILAAPGDAEGARAVVEAVVDQLNLGAAKRADVRLDLTLLDDGSLPSADAGSEAIFVTVLWTSFSRSNMDSARAARVRFLAAYDKYRNDPGTVKILSFFNDQAIMPSRIDTDQLVMVRDFQDRLRTDGLRAYVCDGREDLRMLVESKLERLVTDLPSRQEDVTDTDAEPAPTSSASAEPPSETESKPTRTDVVHMDERPRQTLDDETLGNRLTPPSLSQAANDDRFVLTALMPLTPELLDEVDRKAWEMVEAFNVIGDVVSFMAYEAKRHVQGRKPDENLDPEMGLIFKMMSRKEEDDLLAFAEGAEERIGMLKEIYQTILNAMRRELHRRRPALEASGYDEDVLDETFRAIAKFSGPLKAAAPHLQTFRSRVSALRRTTAEFHKAKQQAIEFLERYLFDLAALRGILARNPSAEVSSRG
jgi:hypothetical protein